MQRMRLFWAINLPEELKRHLCNEIKHPLQDMPVNLKWVEEQNIHLTLQFLGDVESSRVEEIVSAVRKEIGGFGQLSFEVKGIGCFPGDSRPRVFWAGLGGQVEKLYTLQSKIQRAHIPLGFLPEKRPFSPHITLARFRSSANSEMFLQRLRKLVPASKSLGSFKANSVELMQSILSPKGPTYKILESVLL